MILEPVNSSRNGGSIITASCPASASAGDVVYVSGDRAAGVYQVDLVDVADTDSIKSIGIGIIAEKHAATECSVYLQGILTGVYSGLTPGKRLFVDENARLSHAIPLAPGTGKRKVQKVAYALASDTIIIRPEEPISRISI